MLSLENIWTTYSIAVAILSINFCDNITYFLSLNIAYSSTSLQRVISTPQHFFFVFRKSKSSSKSSSPRIPKQSPSKFKSKETITQSDDAWSSSSDEDDAKGGKTRKEESSSEEEASKPKRAKKVNIYNDREVP